MMSLPDFTEKQLLIISANDIKDDHLQFKNQNICLVRNGSIVNQLSCHKVFGIWIIGDLTITSVLIRKCHEYGVSLFLLKRNFLSYASLTSIASGNYLLREKQYTEKSQTDIAQNIVINKLLNQLILLGDIKGKKTRKTKLKELRTKISKMTENKTLLGFEGSQSKLYFSKYFSEIGWYRRMPRAKVDEINVLMDIGYTMLFNFIDALLGLYGFDPHKGVYHKLFFQRKSLVCDLMEPFRSIIDHQILKSFHLKQIDKKDFKHEKGQYCLQYDKQKKYIMLFSDALMERKKEMFMYIREYYYCIMNDIHDYPLFFIE